MTYLHRKEYLVVPYGVIGGLGHLAGLAQVAHLHLHEGVHARGETLLQACMSMEERSLLVCI